MAFSLPTIRQSQQASAARGAAPVEITAQARRLADEMDSQFDNSGLAALHGTPEPSPADPTVQRQFPHQSVRSTSMTGHSHVTVTKTLESVAVQINLSLWINGNQGDVIGACEQFRERAQGKGWDVQPMRPINDGAGRWLVSVEAAAYSSMR